MVGLINQTHEGAEALLFAAYWNAPHNTHQQIIGNAHAHLGADGHVEVAVSPAFIELDAQKVGQRPSTFSASPTRRMSIGWPFSAH